MDYLHCRAQNEHLERIWWEEEADLANCNLKTLPADAAEPSWHDFMISNAGEAPGVPVRSGIHEVDLEKRLLQPCYWPANRHRVMRATWFAEKSGEWVPLKESLADSLETGYRSAVWLPRKGLTIEQPDGSGPAARFNFDTSVEKSGLYALFYSETEAYLVRDSNFAWLAKLGATSAAAPNRMRLRRGYQLPTAKGALEKEADIKQEVLDDAAAAVPVTHLLLAVHGIGQTLSRANIAQDALAIRAAIYQVARDQEASGGLGQGGHVGRIEVLPVQWRKTVNLEVDMMAAQLMPPGIPGLRQVMLGLTFDLI